MPDASHENLTRDDDVKLPSERSFAITFAVVFALIALFPLLHGGPIRWWSFGVAIVFLAVGLIAPTVLRPLNRLWLKFGLLLHKVVNPLILSLMFGLMIVPVAMLIRLSGRKLLSPKTEPGTYWVRRTPGPTDESIRNQF